MLVTQRIPAWSTHSKLDSASAQRYSRGTYGTAGAAALPAALLLLATPSLFAQPTGDATPASSNVAGAHSPGMHRDGRVTFTLADALRKSGVHLVYFESPGTAHEWQTWRRDLRDLAPRLFR